MTQPGRKQGFSLMEVMFAVAILALGVVFVACQFPVGLALCRDVIDNTSHGINTHNAQTQLELESVYGRFTTELIPTLARRYYPINQFSEPGYIHFLVKPNVLADPVPPNYSLYGLTKPQPVLIADDIEYSRDPITFDPTDPLEYFNLQDYIFPSVVPRWPFWRQHGDWASILLTTNNGYNFLTDFFLGDIGSMALPPVDGSDAEVERILREGGDREFGTIASWLNRPIIADGITYENYLRDLNLVLFEVALQRRYSWAAMYSNYDLPIQYIYIFTLRNPAQQVRYAVQHPLSFVYRRRPDEAVDPLDPLFTDQPEMRPRPVLPSDGDIWLHPRFRDRVFPVPWRVSLDEGATGFETHTGNHPTNVTHFFYDHNNGSRTMMPNPLNPSLQIELFVQTFSVDSFIGKILRPGSIIIDADPGDIWWGHLIMDPGDPTDYSRTYEGCGFSYEVQDIQPDPAYPLSRYVVTLKTPLLNDMSSFWVFPPPIKRYRDKNGIFTDQYEFTDQQPVINMTKKTIR
ncbi:prepilin-type N-terminal cleavage/methylation domain-containing protein [Planctomycetota bacterium]